MAQAKGDFPLCARLCTLTELQQSVPSCVALVVAILHDILEDRMIAGWSNDNLRCNHMPVCQEIDRLSTHSHLSSDHAASTHRKWILAVCKPMINLWYMCSHTVELQLLLLLCCCCFSTKAQNPPLCSWWIESKVQACVYSASITAGYLALKSTGQCRPVLVLPVAAAAKLPAVTERTYHKEAQKQHGADAALFQDCQSLA